MANELTAITEQGVFCKPVAGIETFTDEFGGPATKVGDEDIALLDVAYRVGVVQPGTVMNNKDNKDLVKNKGKLSLTFGKDEAEYVDELWVKPVTIVSYGFSMFDKQFAQGDDNAPVCYSTNGLTPAQDVLDPMNPVCAESVLRNGIPAVSPVCPRAVWVKGGGKPQCQQRVTVGLFDLERKIPLILSLHGTGMAAWNSLCREYANLKNRCRWRRESMSSYALKITLEDRGTYYVPTFTLAIPPAEITDGAGKYDGVCAWYAGTVFARRQESAQSHAAQNDALPIETESEEISEMTL
ncbi:MAG: hypothetical protein ACI4P0_05665 [Mailhella sp.]